MFKKVGLFNLWHKTNASIRRIAKKILPNSIVQKIKKRNREGAALVENQKKTKEPANSLYPALDKLLSNIKKPHIKKLLEENVTTLKPALYFAHYLEKNNLFSKMDKS